MKKSLIVLAVLAAFSAEAQTTFGVEYDYHKNTTTQTKSHYWAVGIMQGTEYGTFDAWLQGSNNRTYGVIDNLKGWELGYSYSIPISNFVITPRIAYGSMNNIDMGGYNGDARYVLTTLEGSYRVNDRIGLFTGFSHTKGLNADAIQSWNRITAGTDIGLTNNMSFRIGASYIRQLQTNQYGAFGILTYTLN